MAQKYILIKHTDTEAANNGLIAINKSVFYSIAELSIDEIENAIRIPKTKFNKPLSVKIIDNKLDIYADLKVKYLADVNQTCELVQNKIYENVYNMTGFRANSVQINVIGFEV
ncbi:MAG: Asp23/Gls24 family envelope stress response protein [Solobacterium sp.]|nr:Asp23/Gls24 family envelope stress response protein [Solobacterium sp.]